MTEDLLLDVGSAFDWITPTIAFIQDIRYGPPASFGIPSVAGWGRSDIKRLLQKYGVRVWGLMLTIDGEVLMFSVPASKAKWAYYLLQREGVPLLYSPV